MKPYNDCMEVREDFSAYLDGEMIAEARTGIEAHLAICAECLRELDALKRVDDSYRKLDHIAAPAGFEASVHEAVRAGRMPSAANQRSAPRWMGPLVAMASAAAVLIIGVLVLEQRQSAPGEMLLADTLAASEKSAAALFDAAAPARKESTWENFAKAPASAGLDPADGGREDSSEALAQGLAATDNKDNVSAEGLAHVAESLDANAEARARAELIGTPPPEEDTPLAPPAPEKILDAPASTDQFKADASAAPAPRAAIGAGEVLSRQTLRSFRVGADGIWYQQGYANQPRTTLVRETPALRELMKRHSGEDWSKLLDREYRQVFEIDGAWYELEAAPQETN